MKGHFASLPREQFVSLNVRKAAFYLIHKVRAYSRVLKIGVHYEAPDIAGAVFFICSYRTDDLTVDYGFQKELRVEVGHYLVQRLQQGRQGEIPVAFSFPLVGEPVARKFLFHILPGGG